MSKQDLINVLLSAHMTEKTMRSSGELPVYVFAVLRQANKEKIKHAVEFMFNTKVSHVRIVNVKQKSKRFAQIAGRTKAWKKAYVTLKNGEQIDFTSFQA